MKYAHSLRKNCYLLKNLFSSFKIFEVYTHNSYGYMRYGYAVQRWNMFSFICFQVRIMNVRCGKSKGNHAILTQRHIEDGGRQILYTDIFLPIPFLIQNQPTSILTLP